MPFLFFHQAFCCLFNVEKEREMDRGKDTEGERESMSNCMCFRCSLTIFLLWRFLFSDFITKLALIFRHFQYIFCFCCVSKWNKHTNSYTYTTYLHSLLIGCRHTTGTFTVFVCLAVFIAGECCFCLVSVLCVWLLLRIIVYSLVCVAFFLHCCQYEISCAFLSLSLHWLQTQPQQTLFALSAAVPFFLSGKFID